MNISQTLLESFSKLRSNIISLLPIRKEMEEISSQLLQCNSEIMELVQEIKSQGINVKEYNQLTAEQKEFFREIDEKYESLRLKMISLEDEMHQKVSEFALKYPYLLPSLNKHLANVRSVYRSSTYIFGWTFDNTSKKAEEDRKHGLNSLMRNLGVDVAGSPGQSGGNFGGGSNFNLN